MNYALYPWQTSQDHLINHAIMSGRLSHALLLCGESGLGKLDFAKQLTKRLLCQTNSSTPCNRCRGCLWFDNESHPDFYNICQIDETIKVDMIREVVLFLQQKSHVIDGNRVILIALAEHMNQAAANALLKVLEEPNQNTYFILVSSNQGQLLPTIKSRSQMIHFPVNYSSATVNWLATRGYSAEKVQDALAMAQGRPLLALTYLSDPQFLEEYAQKSQDIYILSTQRQYQLAIAERWQKQDLLPLLDQLCMAIYHGFLRDNPNNQLVTQINQHLQKWHNVYKTLIDIRRTVIAGYNLNKNLMVDKILQVLGD